MNRGTMTFYVNEEQQGQVAFQNLWGIVHPAICINRNAAVTIHTALDPPSSDQDSDGVAV
jgi:tripartite motif-containing protein 9/67